MAPLGPRKLDVVNAKTTDISGLLNVLEWSPRGTNVKAFGSLTSLHQDPELYHDKDVQDAINKLSSLLNNGFAVIEEKGLEVLAQLQHEL
ncbi:Hypothetical predicted protein, partial [Paramuricea clavata]